MGSLGGGSMSKNEKWEDYLPYHICVSPNQIGKYVLLPGDPSRVGTIARYIETERSGKIIKIGGLVKEEWENRGDRFSLEVEQEEIAGREFVTMTTLLDEEKVSITSTGIGGSSSSIALNELLQIGAHTFIRIGTSGSIRPEIAIGDVVITSASVRLDEASKHYAPIEYPAVSHPIVLMALIQAAAELSRDEDWSYHVGITASTDTFYPGQCRGTDSFLGYLIRSIKESKEEWQALNVLNYEMETGALFTIGNVTGARIGAIEAVIVERTIEGLEENPIRTEETDEFKKRAIAVGVDATKKLIKWDREKKIDFSTDLYKYWDPENLDSIKLLESFKRRKNLF